MSLAPTLSEYSNAKRIVDDREYWSQMTLLTGVIVSLSVLVAGWILDDGGIMFASGVVIVAFCMVSMLLLLSLKKHYRVLTRAALYSE